MKHTPGKWEVISPQFQKPYSIKGNGVRIADNILSRADARLIAAVPDLLEACKYTIKQLKNVKGKTFPIMPILNAIQKADLSIVDKS